MIEFMSSWVKGLGLAIVIVSILEMLLPNNKTKKYIRMVIGLYILFTIVSPFLSNKELFDLNELNLEDYTTAQTSTNLNQTSMDERISELYIQELEKDITKKIEEMGYEATSYKVKAQISDQEEESKISQIKLNIQKSQESENSTRDEKEENLENQIVTQIQKIKPVNTTIQQNDLSQGKNNTEEAKSTKLDKSDIQNIKKILIEEYGVNEKCLEIN